MAATSTTCSNPHYSWGFRARARSAPFLRRSGRIVRACSEAVHHTSHYLWLRNDKVYAEAFEAAKQIAADHFEDEIYRRGFEGYDKPVTYQGEIKDHYKDYSDVLAKLELPEPAEEWLPVALENTGIAWMLVTPAEALRVRSLPWHHRDPFDRLLIAQAITEYTLVTHDNRLGQYESFRRAR